MKMTIEELAAKINTDLPLSTSNDKRYNPEVSVRRIRDYISKGMLEKPLKNGKTAYFTEVHYNKLMTLRELQVDGLSDQLLKKISSSISSDSLSFSSFSNSIQEDKSKQLQNDALMEIQIMQGKSLLRSKTLDITVSSSSSLFAATTLQNHYQSSNSSLAEKMEALNFLNTSNSIFNINKINYDEYSITQDNSIVLKISNDLKQLDEVVLLDTIKKVIQLTNNQRKK